MNKASWSGSRATLFPVPGTCTCGMAQRHASSAAPVIQLCSTFFPGVRRHWCQAGLDGATNEFCAGWWKSWRFAGWKLTTLACYHLTSRSSLSNKGSQPQEEAVVPSFPGRRVEHESWPWPAVKVPPENYIYHPPSRHCLLVKPRTVVMVVAWTLLPRERRTNTSGRFMSPSRIEDARLSSRDRVPRLHGSLHPAVLGIPESHCIRAEERNTGPGEGGRARKLLPLALAPQERQGMDGVICGQAYTWLRDMDATAMHNPPCFIPPPQLQ